MPLYNLLYVAGIIFFAYFYTAIIFNPDDVARTCGSTAASCPGIRPGKRTAEYIDTILRRITLAGAIYLAIIAIIPNFLISGFRVAPIPFIGEARTRRCRGSSPRGLNGAVLLRRHLAADRRRRGDGYGAAGGVAADHAALRRLHEEDADPRDAGRKRPSGRDLGTINGAEPAHARPTGCGERKRRRNGSRRSGDPEDLDRRHPARGRGDRTEIGLRAKAIMDRGELVSDEVMIGIVRERLGAPTRATGSSSTVSADGGAGAALDGSWPTAIR
jgi:hypothetical protein